METLRYLSMVPIVFGIDAVGDALGWPPDVTSAVTIAVAMVVILRFVGIVKRPDAPRETPRPLG